MRPLSTITSRLGGRRVTVGIGLFYVLVALVFPVTPPAASISTADVVLTSLLAGVSGIVIASGGYLLPRTRIRPDLYHVVARWCLRAIFAMGGLLGFLALATELSNLWVNLAILTGLAGVAGFGMGYHDGKARTRAVNAEEYSHQLERYQTIVETVNDGIFVTDANRRFKLVNQAYVDLVGYDRETLLGSHISIVVAEDIDSIADEIDRELETDTPGTRTHESRLETASGETIEIEATVAHLPSRTESEHDYVGVVRDVTERNQREQALELANERLEESNQRLEQFAYAASHDLQEPLRMVSSYLQLIESRADDELSEETEEFLDYAVDGADRMRAMIDGLLRYSRVDAQAEPLVPVDLDEVMTQVCDDLDVRISESNAELTVEELPRVVGDEDQLRQVLQNLLKNAIEYSGDDAPRIHVFAEQDGSEWTVSVRDEGIGIDPAHQRQIFEVFQRLQSREESNGSGIGLALCERIIERHEGTIWVDSEPGEGATFSFTLPAAAACESPPAHD